MNLYQDLASKSLENLALTEAECLSVLNAPDTDLLSVLDAAYRVRHHYWQNKVTIHVINNTQNGHCPEDCNYCAQAKTGDTNIESYGMKGEEEILAEADQAYAKGAYRYCMVLSGRGPTPTKVERLSGVIAKIKAKHPDKEVCLSAGLMNDDTAQHLRDAGLDRLNHNLNSSESHYPNICSTHTFQDRLNTLEAGKKAGLELCSGIIAGLGETQKDLIELAHTFRRLEVPSIPVNFLVPVPGTPFENVAHLTPVYCLKILCLFRFVNPKNELRIAGGREYHLRHMQVMGLYPANSLFMDGYLNVTGSNQSATLQMMRDAGFEIDGGQSDFDPALLQGAQVKPAAPSLQQVQLKSLKELRPTI